MTKYLRKIKNKLIIKEAKELQKAEIQAERRHRFLLVIKARWAIMAFYLVYSLFAVGWLYYKFPNNLPVKHFVIYAIGLVIIASYNIFLHFTYKRLSQFRSLAQVHMIMDVLITTVIIHFTGGVGSWFWSIYLFVILQSAFLFDRKIETTEIAVLAGLAFGFHTTIEHSGIIKSFSTPFLEENYGNTIAYESLKVFWVFSSSISVAIIASHLLGIIRQKERYLANKSITDGLTGLYNHSHFYKRLDSELERAKRYKRNLSLVLIDLDDFKKYNDTFGHQAGDKLLRALAKILKENVRANDVDTVYRYGGDEFAIIAPETSSQDEPFKQAGAFALAERIRETVKRQLQIGLSIGVSSFPDHGSEISNIFKAADLALYKAKDQGKNRVVNSSKKLIIEKLKNGAVKN